MRETSKRLREIHAGLSKHCRMGSVTHLQIVIVTTKVSRDVILFQQWLEFRFQILSVAMNTG